MGPVDVVNIALAEIGAQSTVSSINPSDGSTEGNVASILYVPKIQALERAAHWNCTRKQIFMTMLKAAVINGVASDKPPPYPWQYEYLYPTDCIKARYVMPYVNQMLGINPPLTTNFYNSPPYFLGPPVKFAVATDIVDGKNTRVILSNQENAILVYTSDVNQTPDMWDPHFLGAATSFLGAWFANALTRNTQLYHDQTATAKEMIAQARISDGDEGLTSADHLPDWMQVRGFTGDFLNAGILYQGWDTIGFPGGYYF